MNYASLKADINNWLARSDISDEAVANDIIDLAEARINRLLRIRAMETVYNETITSGVTDYPALALEFKHLYLYEGAGTALSGVGVLDPTANAICEIEWRGFDAMSREIDGSSGNALFATRQGDKILYWPLPNGEKKVSGIYYAAFTALDDLNTTNWLTANAPDLLLASVLREAAAYIKSPQWEQYWDGRRNQAMTELQDADDRAEYSATPLTQRVKSAP